MEVDPPQELPAGWSCLEHRTPDGAVRVTYTSAEGVAGFDSVAAAIRHDAKVRGADADKAVQEYEQQQQVKTERDALSNALKQQVKDLRERYIAAYRAQGPALSSDCLPQGWHKVEMPQKRYVDPEGRRWVWLKDIEVYLGSRLVSDDSISATVIKSAVKIPMSTPMSTPQALPASPACLSLPACTPLPAAAVPSSTAASPSILQMLNPGVCVKREKDPSPERRRRVKEEPGVKSASSGVSGHKTGKATKAALKNGGAHPDPAILSAEEAK